MHFGAWHRIWGRSGGEQGKPELSYTFVLSSKFCFRQPRPQVLLLDSSCATAAAGCSKAPMRNATVRFEP